MASIKLLPEDGGEAINVTEASTVIGRGAFLKVIDKRVSRSHALLEVIDGKLHLTPTHTNPCFFRHGGKGPQLVLKREVRQPLEEGDMFGLLPDQLFYTITYSNASLNGVKTNGERKEPVKNEPVPPSDKKGKKASKPVRKEESEEEEEEPRLQRKTSFRDVVFADGKNLALPLAKKRQLPAWMIRLSNASAPPVKQKAVPVKKAAPAKRAAPSRPALKKKNEDFFDDEEEEDERPSKKRSLKPKADDDYEEESEEEAPRKRGGKTKRSQRQSDDASDSEEGRPTKRKATARQQRGGAGRDVEESSGRRPRRAATKSIGSYEEDFQLLEFDESDDAPAEGNIDSDFKMEDDGDSGSDWDKRRGSAKKPARKPAGRTPARGGGRNKRRKARRGSDSAEEDFEESEEEYVPRPSKRRGGGGGASQRRRKAAESEEEEEEEEEEELKVPKKARRVRPAKSPAKKEREACYYGAKCYRKNPDHFKEFSHPGDSDYEEEEESDNEKGPGKGRKRDDDKTSKAETVPAPAKKKKKTKSDEEEEDDGLPNTYDYNDSFIDDAGKSSQSQSQYLSQTQRTEDEDEMEEEEDIEELKQEAKSFIRNKK